MAQETYEIVWSENAYDDYVHVLDYLLSNWSEKVTLGFIDIVEKKICLISTHSFIGIASQKDPTIRSILLTKQNRLYYQVYENKIQILNIFDTRQGPSKNKF